MKKSILSSKHTLIEHTAANFAAIWFEAALSSGLKPKKYKTHKAWAAHNYQKFIIPAVEHLTSLLGCDDINEHMKNEIYESLMERINDPDVAAVFPNDKLLPEVDLNKLLNQAPEKPINIVTDYFKNKSSVKSKLLTGVAR